VSPLEERFFGAGSQAQGPLYRLEGRAVKPVM